MKQIANYINEKLHVTSKSFYSCKPKTKDELRKIIIQRIKEDGPDCDLNDIDVSKITDMSHLFSANMYFNGNEIFNDFNGDISLWNVSNVTNMQYMFYKCKQVSCDLSKWDVSNVIDMHNMFDECEKFNGDISLWDVSNVKNMYWMFMSCEKFNSDISRWNVSNVTSMGAMFYMCENFRQNLDDWDVQNVEDMIHAFYMCPTKPKWYK